MSFLVTARKYRPSTFQEVVAQGHVVSTLLNSIKLDRIAHAYLFAGPRGVGKTTTARIFAKALNCPNAEKGEPCNSCDTCEEISQGRSMDVIEIDGASNNSVDQIRAIRDAVRYTPTRDKYKMYIIDEIHMLSKSAFNALLKTLEEPPAHAIFIFATTEPHKLLPTVISRCQRYDFRRIATDDIVEQLRHICSAEGIDAEDAALFAIARRGDGSMRDAESIFDQVVAFSGTSLTYDDVRQVLHFVDQDTFFHLTDLIVTKNSSGGFTLAEQVVMSGYDIQDFLQGLEEHFRNLLVVRSTGEARLIEAPADVCERYLTLAEHFSEGDLLRLLKITAQAMQAVRYSPQPRLKFEVALIDMIKMDSTIEISRLLSNLGPGGSPQLPQTGGTDGTGKSSSVLSSTSGNGDSGRAASGRADSGRADSGRAASGRADSGRADSGRADSGRADSGRADSGRTAEDRRRVHPVDASVSTDASVSSDATEPLRQAEKRFRQALHSASLSAVAPYGPPPPAAEPPPYMRERDEIQGSTDEIQGSTDAPGTPPPPIVQMLINDLGAVLIKGS